MTRPLRILSLFDRSETPGRFADAWWAANLPRLTQE